MLLVEMKQAHDKPPEFPEEPVVERGLMEQPSV